MLSYRHGYHAGNLADVLKHAILTAVLDAALAKESPLAYLDTHAGAGAYRLDRGGEHEAGIGALRTAVAADPPPHAIARYLACVEAATVGDGVHPHYPGSALIAAHMLRGGDRLLLAELHPADHAVLARVLRHDPRVTIGAEDGYALLKSALPPRERRGVVLIDPAYELATEPARVIDGLRNGLARFRHGVFLVWYPLRGKHDVATMKRHFRRLAPPKTLRVELDPAMPARAGATGSGVWIVNPPFNAVAAIESLTTYLRRTLATGGRASCDWLVPEA